MDKNYYEILGMEESLIKYILYEDESIDENKDDIIKSAYEEKKRILEIEYEEQEKKLEDRYNKEIEIKIYGIGMNTNKKRKEKLEKEKERHREKFIERIKKLSIQFEEDIKELTHAYEEIQFEGKRKLYNAQLLKNKKNKERVLLKETAYDFFNISEEKLKLQNDSENDLLIKNEFEKMMKNCNFALQDENLSFRKKQEIENLIKKAKEYYKLIANPRIRKLYSEYLNKEEEKAKNEMRKKYIEAKYSKKEQFDKNLIRTIEKGKYFGEKLVVRRETKNSPTVFLKDERDIRLKTTAEIFFKNFTGIYSSYVNEYQLTRIIDGEEKTDTIYTILSLPHLAIKKDIASPVNLEYYNCVVNELLSEEAIEGSKYNGGYIGMVEKNKYGEYESTLKYKKLNSIEQEALTAVMIMQERKEKNKKREEECK